jgi:hypothetical protein
MSPSGPSAVVPGPSEEAGLFPVDREYLSFPEKQRSGKSVPVVVAVKPLL